MSIKTEDSSVLYSPSVSRSHTLEEITFPLFALLPSHMLPLCSWTYWIGFHFLELWMCLGPLYMFTLNNHYLKCRKNCYSSNCMTLFRVVTWEMAFLIIPSKADSGPGWLPFPHTLCISDQASQTPCLFVSLLTSCFSSLTFRGATYYQNYSYYNL